MKTHIIISLSTFILCASSATASQLHRVTQIVDGDTIVVVNSQNNEVKKVRLACIDAPEDSQPQGSLSSSTLKAFIPVGTKVDLNIVDRDRFDRSVAEVLVNRVNVNISMLNKGQAVVYQKYLHNCEDREAYLQAEAIAKKEQQGFWSDSSFISPEQWRRGLRNTNNSINTQTSAPAINNPRSSSSYIAGTCKYLRSLGLRRFTPGDPNYSLKRDRDRDGIACE